MYNVVFTMSKYNHTATNVTSTEAQRDLSLFVLSVPLSVDQLSSEFTHSVPTQTCRRERERGMEVEREREREKERESGRE